MSRKISRLEAEKILENRFLGKYVKFTYPGYKPVYGRCDRIAIGTGVRDRDMIIIVLGDDKYTCSAEALKDCLTLIKPENGDTHTGGTEPAAGSPQEH